MMTTTVSLAQQFGPAIGFVALNVGRAGDGASSTST